MKLLPSLLLSSVAFCVAAEPPVQLNGWYPCTQSSLQSDNADKGHPDAFYMDTSSGSTASTTARRATADVAQAPSSSLPFLQQSFDRLFAQHHDWKQQEQHKTRRQHGKVGNNHSSGTPQYECAEFRVPMCHSGVCESDNTVDVFVKRVVATSTPSEGKAKALWVLQGGPGASSTGVEGLMDSMFLQLDREVSVYTMDHRGTGRSARLECQAAEAAALGSPGGSAIRLDELPACMDDIRFQIDNQTAAFSVTSAAKDLAAIIDYELSDQDVYVYGLSYGTYLVERLVHFAPQSVRGFSVDGIVSESGDTVEKRSTFSNWDHDVGIVGDRFLAACLADELCKSKFPGVTDLSAFVHELYDKLDAAVAGGKSGTNACADALSRSGMKPSYLLRSTFGEYLMSDRMRLAIPAVIYRASRCTQQDSDALTYFGEGLGYSEEDGGFGDSEPETLLYDSDMLYYLIVFSEMWESPTHPAQVVRELHDGVRQLPVAPILLLVYRQP
ncbi:hypothetical protein KRP22_005377 [Phytophthora ramorum]|nr:putative hydrolase YuaR [Phytophthora ramorum]